MNNASTHDGRGQDGPRDAEPFFPSEGTFKPVVPLSEIGRALVPHPPVDAADAGKPAEADWAREAYRERSKEEEETLVPSRAARAREARPSWVATAAVIALSVVAGLVSGTYLIWSSQRAPEAAPPAQVAAEAPSLPPAPATDAMPAPVAEPTEAVTKVEKVNEPARDERPSEVAKAEKPGEATHAPKQALPPQPAHATRAERVTRAAAEAKETTPVPKPTRTLSAATPRPRPTTAEKRPAGAPASAERTLPISAPPPTAKSKKVIQWP